MQDNNYYLLSNYFAPVTLPILFIILIINLQTKSLPHFPNEDIKPERLSDMLSQESYPGLYNLRANQILSTNSICFLRKCTHTTRS